MYTYGRGWVALTTGSVRFLALLGSGYFFM